MNERGYVDMSGLPKFFALLFILGVVVGGIILPFLWSWVLKPVAVWVITALYNLVH